MELLKRMRRPAGIVLAMVLLLSLVGIPLALSQNETITLHVFKSWDAEPVSYTLTYDLNGGEGSPPPAQTGFANTTIVVTEEIPTREDHAFAGWSLLPDGQVDYQSGDPIVMDSDKTLYASWVSTLIGTMFTVTLHPNGGDGEIITVQVAENTEFELYKASFTRELCLFDSWNTQADNTGTSYRFGSTYLVTKDITFYAHFIPIG